MKVLGVIPARLNSKRFPKKVIYPLHGKPLLYYLHTELKKSKVIDRLVIATDDLEIKKIAEGFGAEVILTSIPAARDRRSRARAGLREAGRIALTEPELSMHAHHQAAIERVTQLLRADPEVQALLLGGSIAHGFERPDSDVDLLIVVSDADHAAREREGRMHWWTNEGCDWSGGYAEGRYVRRASSTSWPSAGSEAATLRVRGRARPLLAAGGARSAARPIGVIPSRRRPRASPRPRPIRGLALYADEGQKQGDRYRRGAAGRLLHGSLRRAHAAAHNESGCTCDRQVADARARARAGAGRPTCSSADRRRARRSRAGESARPVGVRHGLPRLGGSRDPLERPVHA